MYDGVFWNSLNRTAVLTRDKGGREGERERERERESSNTDTPQTSVQVIEVLGEPISGHGAPSGRGRRRDVL